MSLRDIDSHKLGYHPERIAEWKKGGFCYPLHIEAGITNKCNHKCIQCTLDWINHKSDCIHPEVFVKMLHNASHLGVKSIYFAGEGEPTLHKDLPLFVKTAYDLGMKVALSTNGSLFKPELTVQVLPYLAWLRFSVDAATPETFAKIHGVDITEFDKVIWNITFATNHAYQTHPVQIGIQTLLMKENVDEIEELAYLAKGWKVHNFQVKPAHCHPKSSFVAGTHWDSKFEKLEDLNTDDFTVVVRIKSLERLTVDRNYARCHAFDLYALIDACGNVTPCNIFYGDPHFIFGNLYDQSLEDIWKSDRKSQIIDKITDLNHSLCAEYRCRQDVMNRYLERVKNPEINDEFI